MPDTETKIPLRPVPMGEEVINAVVKIVMPDISTLLGKRANADLRDWLLRSVDPNPYLFAKKFEDASGITPDARFLDVFTINVTDKYRDCVRAWVLQNDIKVPSTHQIGSRVSTAYFPKCTVVALHGGSARIGIRPDDFPYDVPSEGFTIPFEDAVPIIGTIGAAGVAVGGAA